MTEIAFTWDDRKDRENQKKHGVSFVEATTAFADENARLTHDHFGSPGDPKRTQTVRTVPMKKQYDFSESVRNPYAKHLKKQVTLRLNTDTITYFKALASETGIPYQNLINLYLTECAHSGKRLTLKWAS